MAALAAATIVLVVIGGVGVMLRTSPDSPTGGDPTILQAVLGPEPEFDTSALGEEQRLDPVTPDSISIPWEFFGEILGDPNPRQTYRQMLVVAGQVESSVVGVGLYAESYVSGRTITDGLCQTVAQSFRTDPGSAAAGGGCTEQTEPVDYGAFGDLGVGDLKDVLVYVSAAFIVPPDTSVVAVDTAGTRKWHRPRGGIALFVGEFLVIGETQFTAYSASGDVLLGGTANFGTTEPDEPYSWGPLAVLSGEAGGTEALIAGTVRITDGCVVLSEQGADVLLLWPSEETIWNTETEAVSFETLGGAIVELRDGDRVSLAGGGSSVDEGGKSASEFLASVDWVSEPDASCVTDTRWFVNDVVNVASDS